MTDEFAVVNVKRNGLKHLISPISHCEWDLAGGAEGGLYGEKPQPLWWALPGDNEGHAAVLSESTDRRAGGPGWAAGRRLSIHAFIFPLYLYPGAGQIGIFIYLHRVRGVIALSRCSLHSWTEMPRANQVRCLLSVPFTHPDLCFENVWGVGVFFLFFLKASGLTLLIYRETYLDLLIIHMICPYKKTYSSIWAAGIGTMHT